MIPLYRTLGIGMGITALMLAPNLQPTTWAQDANVEAAPPEVQKAPEKPTPQADEAQHVKREAAKADADKAPMSDEVKENVDKPQNKSDTDKPGKADKDDPASELERQSKILGAQADLRAKQLAAELVGLKEEATRLKTEAEVAKQRQANDLLKMELEKQRLATEASLRKAQQEQAQSDMKAELDELTTNMQLRDARHKREMSEMKAQIDRLTTERQLDKAHQSQKLADLEDQRDKLKLEMAIKQAEFQKLTIENNIKTNAMQTKLQLAKNELSLKSVEDQQKMQLDGKINYRLHPFDKETGTLYISDRRIKLNGPIITGTADYVCERIHFFNNDSPNEPIFLVIDNCPGGSVMQGYRIVKAIDASTAPVHVVVKSFAASMAAVITTLAPHSYAYPDAIILHHQMSAGAWGNMTDLQQTIDTMKQWELRLAKPVSAKMGISVQEFKKRMYEHRKTGDWDEFADNAVKLKWVDHIVNQIREEGTRKRPQGDPPQPWYYRLFMQDDKGQTYCKLPPLEPMDAYMLYNPGNFYRPE